jgi:hypothetical protein
VILCRKVSIFDLHSRMSRFDQDALQAAVALSGAAGRSSNYGL